MKILFSLLSLVLIGCSREDSVANVHSHTWIIDERYWYIETKEGDKGFLILKDGAKQLMMDGKTELTFPDMSASRMIVAGSIRIEYDDGVTIQWNNGEVVGDPQNKKWFLVQ